MLKAAPLKTVVITGANRGIGLAMTHLCQQRNYQVYALCRQSSPQLDNLGAQSNVTIVTDIELVTRQGIDNIVAALKNVTIDILINNAGILRIENLADLNTTTISEQFNVNALAPLVLSHTLLNNLSAGSKIAMITSRMGSVTDNTSGGLYGYRMSKAALNIAAVSLAQDLAPKEIAVGIYHPGYVQTDMVNSAGATVNGDISSDEAATRLLDLIEELTLSDSGVFRHANGVILPW